MEQTQKSSAFDRQLSLVATMALAGPLSFERVCPFADRLQTASQRAFACAPISLAKDSSCSRTFPTGLKDQG